MSEGYLYFHSSWTQQLISNKMLKCFANQTAFQSQNMNAYSQKHTVGYDGLIIIVGDDAS